MQCLHNNNKSAFPGIENKHNASFVLFSWFRMERQLCRSSISIIEQVLLGRVSKILLLTLSVAKTKHRNEILRLLVMRSVVGKYRQKFRCLMPWNASGRVNSLKMVKIPIFMSHLRIQL